MSGIILTMTPGVFPHPVSSYTVSTPVYEGPLDLLLNLIERAELDITKLALAQVTDQYLSYLHDLEQRNPDEVSSFMVIAARLVQIKSEALLPVPAAREPDEDDPGELLAQQLIVYKRFKEIALNLAHREASGLRTFLRLAPTPKLDTTLMDLSSLSMAELVTAAMQSLITTDNRVNLATIVTAPKVTIREKISVIAQFLKINKHGTFQQLLAISTFRLEVVVTFLALLELVKLSIVQTNQDSLFGDIEILPSEEWNGNLSFELDFIE